MYKVLMRVFPGWHRANSAYALFPFSTPDKSREIFTNQGYADKYSYDPPSFVGPSIPVTTWRGVVDFSMIILSSRSLVSNGVSPDFEQHSLMC